MPRSFVQTEVSGGGTISFAVEEVTGVGTTRINREGSAVIAKLDEPLAQAIASARPAAQTVVDTFKALRPDEMTVEFGLNIDAQAGAVFAKGSVAAHFNVTMTWSPRKQTPDAEPPPTSGKQSEETQPPTAAD